jgi:alpha-glucosidase
VFRAIRERINGIKMIGPRVAVQSVLYPYRKAFHSGRFAHVQGAAQSRGSLLRGLGTLLSRPEASTQQRTFLFPGRVLAHQWHSGQRIELTCQNAIVEIAVLAPDLMRVRVSPTGRLPAPFSYAVAKADQDWAPVEITVEETRDHLLIRTARLHCRVDKAHLSIAFLDPDGAVINADAAGVGWEQGTGRVACWKHLPPSEHLYGLGQKTTPLDKRAGTFEMWNTDPQFYHPGEDPIYANIPFYQGLVDGRAYGLFFDNSARGWFDFGVETPDITRFEAACGEMRYYFFYGPSLATVLERYTELTGRMRLPPLWALGYHQNRWSYYPEARVREIARAFRARRIPCEAIHLDIDYMDGFRCFTWDAERFPDPKGLIQDLHDDGFKVVSMIDPGIKVDPAYGVYAQGKQEDAFCKYPDGKPFVGPVWPGACCFPDFTSARVRAWWGALYRDLVDLGVDGFWNDMNEPAIISTPGDTLPDVVQHEWEGQGSDHRTAHNVYGMQMARASVEGLTALRPGERPLLISRSMWAGAQRFAMHWLGDNYSDWDSLRNTVPLVLNMGLSGVAFTGPDTGGFVGTPSGELLARWNQLSAFTPFFRNHTASGTKDQEPWAFGDECERISRQFIELRYHLLPYLYTAFWQSAQRGIPIMRPLVLAFQDDPHVTGIDDQFMLGDAFLVAPVLESGCRSRRVYIPRGRWYDFWTGTLTAGPQITRVEAPLDRMPLLVRAGAAVPAWPAMLHTAEKPVDQLILHVYPGDGQSSLYQDDGHSDAFEQGHCSVTQFTCRAEPSANPALPRRLTIARCVEGPFDPGITRVQVAVHGLPSAPAAASVDGQPVADPLYDLDARTVTFETGLFERVELAFE